MNCGSDLKRRGNGKKKYLIIISIVVCFAVIGFAALSTNLTLSGKIDVANKTWNVHFDNVVVKHGSVTSTPGATIVNDTEVAFSAALAKPGDYYEFLVDIVNDGTIDAMIDNIYKGPELTAEQAKYFDYTVMYECGGTIDRKDLLPAGTTYTIAVKVKYRTDLDLADLPSTNPPAIDMTYGIDYIMNNGEGKSPTLKDISKLSLENTGASNLKGNSYCLDDYNDGVKSKMYGFKHPATEQTPALVDYRFIGGAYCRYQADGTSYTSYINPDGTCPDRIKVVGTHKTTGSKLENVVYDRADYCPAADTDYTYVCTHYAGTPEGTEINNYVKFNNELWRMIGVFPTDDGTGTYENRIKLIRADGFDNVNFDDVEGDTNTNLWRNSTLKTLLNEGDYWNRTGTYASVGLTNSAKAQIAPAKYYTGGAPAYTNVGSNYFYNAERKHNGANGSTDPADTSWVGYVGLASISDYLYTYDKKVDETCIADTYDCADSGNPFSSWYMRGTREWLLTPSSWDSNSVMSIERSGYYYSATTNVNYDVYLHYNHARPVVYLKANVKLAGAGTYDNPYVIY